MKLETTGTGNTIEEAIENAKQNLGAPEDAEIQHEILQFPKKKLFGLKTEPAKVLVWYERPDPRPAKPEKKPAPVKDERPAPKAQEKPAAKPAAQKPQDKPAPKAQEKPKKQNPPAKKEPASAPAPAAEEKRIPLEIKETDAAAAYLRMIVKGLAIDSCEMTLEQIENTEEYVYNLSCGDADGVLIGRRGETLDAIQYLVRLSENKGLDEDKHRKISVNVGDYREKRNGNLRSLAHRQARQVLKYGRNIALDPMSPYERRIIHTTIQGIEGVTSHSVGSDANRKVIISLEEGVTPTHGSRGGYNNNRGGRRQGGGGRGGRGGYQKKEAYTPAVTREPRKDSEGSLYGRIEIPKKNEEA